MLIGDFWQAFQKGKQLSNSTAWKERTIAGGLFTSFLISVVAISKGFGVDLGVDDKTIEAAAYGIAAMYSMFASISTAVTSAKVGLFAGGEITLPLETLDKIPESAVELLHVGYFELNMRCKF